MERTYPGPVWERASPEEVGMSEPVLAEAREEVEARSNGDPYRVVVVRGGRIVAEWTAGMGPDERVWMASAAKSIFASMLGVAVEEGMVDSPDDYLREYYPEALDVLPGEGPKEGRHARHRDREITLRQLISNTSGYLKPGERPGEVKHYQTFGMNVLCHAIASQYGVWDAERPPRQVDTITRDRSGTTSHVYDTDDPDAPPGFSLLVDTRFRVPLQADWRYYVANFTGMPDARLSHFGYYPGVTASARDIARLGWLWCNWGQWEGEQLVPEGWLRESVRPAPAERAADPEDEMIETYGQGFWTNGAGALWPSLPRDSFAASGAGSVHVWVCPSHDLVVAQSPGVYDDQTELDEFLLGRVVDAVADS